MDILSIVGLAVVAAAIALVLRQHRPEFALLVSLATGLFILLYVSREIGPVVEQIQEILDTTAMPVEYASILFRALGICFITQIACDACKDAGEGAISAKVEMAGKVAVLVISLPLFRQVLSIVYSLIQ